MSLTQDKIQSMRKDNQSILMVFNVPISHPKDCFAIAANHNLSFQDLDIHFLDVPTAQLE